MKAEVLLPFLSCSQQHAIGPPFESLKSNPHVQAFVPQLPFSYHSHLLSYA